MSFIGLNSLRRGLLQAGLLAMVLSPVVFLSCCAFADQARGDASERHFQAQSCDNREVPKRIIAQRGETNPLFSTTFLPYEESKDQDVDYAGKKHVAFRSLGSYGKIRLLQRFTAQYTNAALGGYLYLSVGLVANVDPSSKSSIHLPAEYALLRRLLL